MTSPERHGKKTALADLSRQTSGLERLPSNFTPKDPFNPYADYTRDEMYQFLSGYKLTGDIGAKYEYSNLGVGLHGHVLSPRAGMSQEALVMARIATPLGMTSTMVALTPEMKARFENVYDGQLRPASAYTAKPLAGAMADEIPFANPQASPA